MPPDANEVQEALQGVLDTDNNAESQSAPESSPEVTDALKSVLETKSEPAADDPTEKSTKDDGKGSKTVPYERLSEVVQQKNEISGRYDGLKDQFDTAAASAKATEQDLRDRIGQMEQSSQMLEAIKDLAQDERYREHVKVIDRALQGIEEEVETAADTGDNKAESTALKKFEAKTAELDEMLSDQRAEKLWSETADSAKSMLAALPEDYTDEDRALIGKLWTPRVDWDGIEEKGSDAISSTLTASLANVIKEYGTPKGALVAKTTKDIEARVPEARQVSDDDAIKAILSKDFGAMEDGKAVVSEADFTKDMAELMRVTQRNA